MSSAPYSVSIVLDRSYGPRIRELLQAGPVWAVDSPQNRDCAQQLWSEFPARDHRDGITVFVSTEDQSPELMLVGEMDTIDLHYGTYSADPAVHGHSRGRKRVDPEVRRVLARFGFDSFTIINDGFDAVRPLPPPSGE